MMRRLKEFWKNTFTRKTEIDLKWVDDLLDELVVEGYAEISIDDTGKKIYKPALKSKEKLKEEGR